MSHRSMGASLVVFAWGLGLANGAQWLTIEKYGDGADGALTVASSSTDSPVDASCNGTAGATTLSATNSLFGANQILLIHQTRGSGAGNWELNAVQSYATGVVSLKYSLANNYVTDGGANRAQVIVVRRYSSVTVSGGAAWTAKSWNGYTGGILAFMCRGTTLIDGTINAYGNASAYVGDGDGVKGSGASGIGFSGGNAVGGQSYCGEGYGSAQYQTRSANYNGGGGGLNNGGGGGGGGGHASPGSDGWEGWSNCRGFGGGTAGNAALTVMTFGGGAGGGEINGPGKSSGGGAGGAIVAIFSKAITVNGAVNANGGGSGYANYATGGGGAGGSVLVKANTAALGPNRITATGGVASISSFNGGSCRGGNGSSGRIHLDYATSYTGSTNPGLNASQNVIYSGNEGPVASSLQTESAINPANVTDTTPEFSALVGDPEGEAATAYQIQVNTQAGFGGAMMWDSGKTAMTSTPNGSRTPAISYAGTALALDESTYYWRIKLWDVNDNEGNWSTETAYFTMANSTLSTPLTINHQGVVGVNGVRFTGSGLFKFALFAGGTFKWSNDGYNPPVNPVSLGVNDGVYSVTLGDTGIPNMGELPPDLTAEGSLDLRIWFDDDQGHGEQLLAPDQPLASVAFALRANTVSPRSIGSAELANSAVSSLKLADDAGSLDLVSGGVMASSGGNIGIGTASPGQKLDIVGGNGRVQSGYSWLTSSDARQKKNITPLPDVLDKLLKIRGVRFDMTSEPPAKPGKGRHIGLIAQDVEAQFPELVVTDEKGYKALDYARLTPLLLEAIRQQQQRIEALEKRLITAPQDQRDHARKPIDQINRDNGESDIIRDLRERIQKLEKAREDMGKRLGSEGEQKKE